MASVLPAQTGRRRHLLRDHRLRSGSSSTAGERLTTPCSPPLLLLLRTPSLHPSTAQRETTRPTAPLTSLHSKRPGRGPTVFLQRDRKCRRAARTAAVAMLKPRNTRFLTPHPIRINQKGRNTLSPKHHPISIRPSFRKCPLLLLHPVLCSPGGASGQWLRPREKGT